MDALERSYSAKRKQYDTMIASRNPNIAEIKKLNKELSAILDSMLTELAKVKEDAGHIEEYRNELVKKLVAVQKDYNNLADERDDLATLKALRGHQEVQFNSTFFYYAIALAIVSIIFFFVLMWKGGYRAPTMPTMMSSPTTMAPFTYR
jgi:cell division protein FtsB